MTEIKLTSGQQQTMIDLVQFATKDIAECFVLKGYAGTGKTFLLKQFSLALQQLDINFVLVAPTGRATKVLRERTGYAARTVHSLIYEIDLPNSTIEASDEEGENKFELIFDLKINNDSINTIYIVDESSMLSNKLAPQETLKFGTGKLLEDLMTYIKPNKNMRKVIFVGDDAQLPPIQSSHSVALDGAYLKEYFGITVKETILTEVYRQTKESNILSAATDLREHLNHEDFNRFPVKDNISDLLSVTLEELMTKYTVDNNWKKSIFITETNKAAYIHTLHVRELLSLNDLSYGERLLVTKNTILEGYPLYNGDFIRVDWVSDKPETRDIFMKYKNEQVFVELKYRDVMISFRNEAGKAINSIKCKIFENLLWNKEAILSDNERRAMIIDFQKRHPHIRPGTIAFKNLLQNDPYFNALQVRFGYVITCHKAQGGEWDEVYIDMKYSQSIQSRSYFRWSYTAITRAKEIVYFLNLPNHGDALEEDRFQQVSKILEKAILPLSATIIDEKASNYENIYYIQVGNNIYRVKLWHNKKDILTNSMFISGPEDFREQLMNIFNTLHGRSIYDQTPL